MLNKNKRSLIMISVLVLMVALGLPAYTATLTVDGSDSGCDDSTGAPYCTIQAAVDDAESGNTIEINNNYVYEENVLVEKPLVLEGVPEGTGTREERYPNIDGGWVDGHGNYTDAGDALFLRGTEDEPIEGAQVYELILKNGGIGWPGPEDGAAGALWFWYVNESDVVVVDASESEVGIGLSSSDNNVIRNSFIHDNSWRGITLFGSNDNTIRDSEIYNNDRTGVWIGQDPWHGYPAEGNKVVESTIQNNDGAGIQLSYADNTVIGEGNIVRNNNFAGLALNWSNNTVIKKDNTFSDNEFGLFSHSSFVGLDINNSEFNNNFDSGTAFFANKTEEEGLVLTTVEDLYVSGSYFNNNLGSDDEHTWGWGLKSHANMNDVTIKGSEFNNNIHAGISFYSVTDEEEGKEVLIGLPKVSNLSITDSDFDYNRHGFESHVNVEGMTVKGSSFSDNEDTGMGFYNDTGWNELENREVLLAETGVTDLSIVDSHFDNNSWGGGFKAHNDVTNMSVDDSTFNENGDTGMAFYNATGWEPVGEDDYRRILLAETGVKNLSITGSEFLNNRTGFEASAEIEGMTVTGSSFSENEDTGMGFYNDTGRNELEQTEYLLANTVVSNLSIVNSHFDDNLGIYKEDGEVVHTWGTGFLAESDVTNMSVIHSTFNYNGDQGMAFYNTKGWYNPETVFNGGVRILEDSTQQIPFPMDRVLDITQVENLSIEESEFDDNNVGFEATAEIEGMTVDGSSFSDNNDTGMAFYNASSWVEPIDDEVLLVETGVRNLTILNSHFDKNGTVEKDTGEVVRSWGWGFKSHSDITNMSVVNSTFNSNVDTGMGFYFREFGSTDVGGEPHVSSRENPEFVNPLIQNLLISGSSFNKNNFSGLGANTSIQGMHVEKSEFNENRWVGLFFSSSYEGTDFENIYLNKSDFKDNRYGVYLKSAGKVNDIRISRSNIEGSSYGISVFRKPESPATDITIHHSNISGNDKAPEWREPSSEEFAAGLVNASNELINAAINWWGSPDGPNYSEDGSLDLDYEGGGDLIVGPVAFAPWITKNPDADPDKPGVQLISPFPIYVHTVGPIPTTENGNTGYLDTAIWGAGAVPQVGQVIVPHGSWKLREPVGNYVELISVKGTTCHTCLKDIEDSKLTVNDDNVTIGKLDGYVPRGFIVKDEVVVKPGVDASTVHLNWNDVRNTVTNNGKNELDAEYNWWGDLDPSDDVSGQVDYRPFLPEDPCEFTDYMKHHDIDDPRAAIAGRMIGSSTCSKKLPSRMIVNYHLKPEEAEEIVDQYGCYDVRLAMKEAPESYEGFMSNLGA